MPPQGATTRARLEIEMMRDSPCSLAVFWRKRSSFRMRRAWVRWLMPKCSLWRSVVFLTFAFSQHLRPPEASQCRRDVG